ncbi:MAG: hypothetical protein LUC33_06325 [Prevotellaceae bacterium]|nr:hypothetical protein [Prevotellaceae bacterium]
MNKKGTHSEITYGRDSELTSLYHALRRQHPEKRNEEIFRMMCVHPTSRFWITYRHALEMMRQLAKGTVPAGIRLLRLKMYQEIQRRAVRLEGEGMDYYTALRKVIQSPAPEFYLTPLSCKEITYRALRRERGVRKMVRNS